MKKVLISSAISIPFLLLPFNSVHAITLNPTNLVTYANTNNVIELSTNISGTFDSVQVGLTLNSGISVISYTPPSSGNWLAPIGNCSNNATFTNNEVCFTLTKASGTITDGEDIGFITLKGTTQGSWDIIAESDNGYLFNGNFTAYPSTTGQIEVLNSLPNTSLSNQSILKILNGFQFIILGFIVLLVIKLVPYGSKQTE